MLILLQCKNGAHCSGIGDRVKGLQTAFWMVRACDAVCTLLVRSWARRLQRAIWSRCCGSGSGLSATGSVGLGLGFWVQRWY